MKKKTIYNLIMVVIIVAIVGAGVVGVGHTRGWFDKADGTVAVLQDVVGVVRMERDGVNYTVEGSTVLRVGDKITAQAGATAVIVRGDDRITLGSGAELTVTDPKAGTLAMELTSGELFINTTEDVKISFEAGQVTVADATVALSARVGAQTLRVFRGTVATINAGEEKEYVGGETFVGTTKLESLNDFLIAQIRKTNKTESLCFTNKDLDDLAEKRRQEIQDIINGSTSPTEPPHVHNFKVTVVAATCVDGGYMEHLCDCGERYVDNETAPAGHRFGDWTVTREATTEEEGLMERACRNCDETEQKTIEKLPDVHVHSYTEEIVAPTCDEEGYTLYTCTCGDSYKDHTVAALGHSYECQHIAPTCTSQGYDLYRCNCGDSYTANTVNALGHNWSDWKTVTEATTSKEGLKERVCSNCNKKEQVTIPMKTGPGYVYITIVCDTILDNLENLKPGKEEFVPSDGEILPVVQVEIKEGDTVFDILMRVCKQMGIALEYSWSKYNSYYIEGINNLYEFDCGENSGWMYKVNGWFPNYGCSAYEVSDGDMIVWCYTCNLGADVGDTWMGD